MIVSEELQTALDKATELVDWIDARLDGIPINDENRYLVPAALFFLAVEHHSSIIKLLKLQSYASAFALFRCEFEFFVRGAWLYYYATDNKLESIIEKDGEFPRIRPMVKMLEQKPEFEHKLLSKIVNQCWDSMNDFTHGGMRQISRCFQGNYFGLNFEDTELIELAKHLGIIVLLAFLEIARLADKEELVEEISARFCSDF